MRTFVKGTSVQEHTYTLPHVLSQHKHKFSYKATCLGNADKDPPSTAADRVDCRVGGEERVKA